MSSNKCSKMQTEKWTENENEIENELVETIKVFT